MNRIAEFRKRAGLTQMQLSEYLKIPQSTLSQYETERRTPDIKTVEMLSEYFSVSVDELLGIQRPEEIPGEKPPLWAIRKIETAFDSESCNIMLSAGWKLLHIGEDRTCYNDGSQSSTIIYTLGWTGNPEDAKAVTSLRPSATRYENYL